MLNNVRNVAVKYGRKLAAAGTVLAASAGSAMAAVSTEVTTAMSDGKADALTIAGGFLLIIIAVGVFKHARRGT